MKTNLVLGFLWFHSLAFSQWNVPVWGVSIAGDFEAFETIHNGVGIWYRDKHFYYSARTDFIDYYNMELSGLNRFQGDFRYVFRYYAKFRPFVGMSAEFYRRKTKRSWDSYYREYRPNGYCYPDGKNYDDYPCWQDRTERNNNINLSISTGASYALTKRLFVTFVAKAGMDQYGFKRQDFYYYDGGRYQEDNYSRKKFGFSGEIQLEYQIRRGYRCVTMIH